MTSQRLLRFEDRNCLVAQTAALLLDTMSARQAVTGSVSVCLTGGDLANQVYDRFADTAGSSSLKASGIHLWWNWDYFVATDNPERNSLQALSRWARALSLDPAKIHPVPSSSLSSDPEAGAAQYAQELKENHPIDICLLELNPGGQIAGIFPDHIDPPSPALAAGITDAPLPHRDLVTLTRNGLNTCREIWILASGTEVAPTFMDALNKNPALPTSTLTGTSSVAWFTDAEASSLMPFHQCTL